jgi:chemotaxis protein methyltransferase CheR
MPVDSGFTEKDYAWFVARVQMKFSVRLADYKPEQMKRRLISLANRCGAASFFDYAALLERDGNRLSQFLEEMTINVTELVRNPELFRSLVDRVLADRFPRRTGEFRVWSAGCSYGAEAYTLAMMLQEKAPNAQFHIRGTDVDLAILARANNPQFSKDDMANVSEDQRRRHFISPDGQMFLPLRHLRDRIEFGHHDLLGDHFGVEQYDLILCRNVLIYFTDQAKERIYARFERALRPGGVLFVGGTERLSDHVASGFRLVQPFFYEKVQTPVLRAA